MENVLLQGNCIDEMKDMDDNSVDMVFADPPYNLQLHDTLYRTYQETVVEGVDEEWDEFDDLQSYDLFTVDWLRECRRILKPTGTIWVIGLYHNIHRVGKIMQDMGFWILNEVIWDKPNATPNFMGTRLQNSHETLIWAQKDKDESYTFNYQTLKKLNGEKQMRSIWRIPICQGKERLKNDDGETLHSTQKPEALLRRIVLGSTDIGDLVVDPFSGTATTLAVSKKYRRNWIGIEQNGEYIRFAMQRIQDVDVIEDTSLLKTISRRNLPRVPFGVLVEHDLVPVGQELRSKNGEFTAVVRADGTIRSNGFTGSIHKTGAHTLGRKTCNGWDYWYTDYDGEEYSLNNIRNIYRRDYLHVDIGHIDV